MSIICISEIWGNSSTSYQNIRHTYRNNLNHIDMFSPITPPTPSLPRSPISSSTFPLALQTVLVDAGSTNPATNISARLPTPQEKMKKEIGKETTVSKVQRHVRAQFILKLHSIITLPNAEIIQWSSDGRAFTIIHPALFKEKLCPEIFAHNIYASFERQLHFYS
jgi:hypothetical protein